LVLALGCNSGLDTVSTPMNSSNQLQLATPQPMPDATQEYLASLPIDERMRAQARIDEKNRQEIRSDAKRQLDLWLENAIPNCYHTFGTKNCSPITIELEPSEVCGWQWSRVLPSLNDVQKRGNTTLC
jgi:hypothetical protein